MKSLPEIIGQVKSAALLCSHPLKCVFFLNLHFIFLAGNQMDSIYFHNPEEFDPERFSTETKSNIPFGSILTFGLGPRACIGQSIFNMEAKILLYHLLQKYKIKPGPNLSYPLRYSMDTFGMHEDQTVILERRKH